MSSSGEFFFHDDLPSSLFAQPRLAPPGDMMMQQQVPPVGSWFADYLQAGAPMPDYDLLCRALDLPPMAPDDVVKRELVVDTGTPSGGGTAPVTPNTTSSMSSSSSEAAGAAGGGAAGGFGGGFGAGEEDSPAAEMCKKEDGDGEESKESGKGEEDGGDKGKKGSVLRLLGIISFITLIFGAIFHLCARFKSVSFNFASS